MKDSVWSLPRGHKKKNKGKVQLGNPKRGRGRLGERSLGAKFKSQFKRGFTKFVMTRAGRLMTDRKENFDCISFLLRSNDFLTHDTQFAYNMSYKSVSGSG